MEVSNQFDGATWATQNNVQIEVYEGGASKRVVNKWIKSLNITNEDLIADIYGFLGI